MSTFSSYCFQKRTLCNSLIEYVAMKSLYHDILRNSYAILCHIMKNNAMSQIAIPYNMHHAVLLHALLCHTISYNLSYHIMSCHFLLCPDISYHIMTCHATSCHDPPWHVMSCHVMPYHTKYHIKPYAFLNVQQGL